MLPIRTFLALALAASCATPALAGEHAGWVYNGMTGSATLQADHLDNGRFASNPNLGYRWGMFGVEAGYTSTFGRFQDAFVLGGARYATDAKVSGWNLGVNANHDFGKRWSVQGRAGLFAWDAETRITAPSGVRVSAEDSGHDWYAGASLDYAWSKKSSVGLGYARYAVGDADMDLWGMHSEYRF
jgi:hypothetical protein